MTDFEITLNLPQHLYDRARQLAAEKGLPVEDVIVSQLEHALADLPALPPDEQAELDALAHLSEDALRTIALEQMPEPRQQRLQALMERNNLGSISAEERAELEALVEQGQRLMLRKAQAMALLAERGHPMHPEATADG